MRCGRRGARGSATIWVLGCCVLLLTIGTVAMVRGLAVLARHRAESSADLAALAAAGRIGIATNGCAVAADIAIRNGTRLVACTVIVNGSDGSDGSDGSGRSGTVTVAVAEAVRLPLVGSVVVRATARAGRLPG